LAAVADLREHHATMLVIACTIITAAFILQLHADGRVGIALLPNVDLPTLCGSRARFGSNVPAVALAASF
jgi:hypothetical protein